MKEFEVIFINTSAKLQTVKINALSIEDAAERAYQTFGNTIDIKAIGVESDE